MRTRNRKMFKVGPIGSKRYYGKSWDEKGHNMISSIYVAFNKDAIKCIQFSYFHNGVHVVSQKYGSSKGQSYEIVSNFVRIFISIIMFLIIVYIVESCDFGL